MNISLIIALFIAACVIAMWGGMYFANRKIKSGELSDKDETFVKKYTEQVFQEINRGVNDTIPPKNSAVIKILPQQKSVVRTGSKIPQTNRKSKK